MKVICSGCCNLLESAGYWWLYSLGFYVMIIRRAPLTCDGDPQKQEINQPLPYATLI